uniref:Peptidase S8/S53 domain-containing protein n=1 Tax=Tetradesmus obliquus TaxID=3088 RepID=A0A383WNH8_TETOB|eukprot:jgi/Sobl393_1/13842/SZX78961.1
MSVGAAYYRQTQGYGVTPAVLETYSSPGLQAIYYTHLGSLLPEPMLLQKPNIVAPDGTQTSYSQNSAGEFHLYGTSAAAPHAAAVAALMLQQNHTLTPDAIYTRMRSTALDMGAPRYDRFTGFGFINGKALLVSG